MSIHPTAVVERGARIGRDVTIGAYAYVGPNVELRDDCVVHHHATVDGHTTIGAGTEIFPQALIGLPPQDLKYRGEKTLLLIGDRNIIRENVTIHPGTASGGGETVIGDDNFILGGVHIAHDCRVGNRCIFANGVHFGGHVCVEDHVNMGGVCAVHHFVTIGKHSFVGGMTRVAADVPPYVVVVAARGTRTEVRMINGVGLQRTGFSPADISELKQAYMRIFSRRARASGKPIEERVRAVLEGSAGEHVEYLCRSLLRSFAHGRHGRYLESLRSDKVHRDTWKPEEKEATTPCPPAV